MYKRQSSSLQHFVKLYRLIGSGLLIVLMLGLTGCGATSVTPAAQTALTLNPASTATAIEGSSRSPSPSAKSATLAATPTPSSRMVSPTTPPTSLTASGALAQQGQLNFKGENYAILTHSEQVVDLSWSPDGKLLATMSSSPAGSTVRWWNSEDGKELTLPTYLNGITSLKWLPDGRMLTLGPATCKVGECDKKFRLWSASGQLLANFGFNTDFVGELKWSPDLKMLAASSQFRHQVWLWKMEDGKLLATLEQSGPFFDWSPDSKKLAVAYYNFDLKTPNECGSASNLPSGVRVWSVETNQSLNLLCGYDSPLFGVRWSWDGKTIATSSEDATSTNNVKTQGIVRLSSPAGQEKTRLYVKASFITNLAWSPDGKTLAVTARNGCYDCIVYENGSDGGIVELWNSEGQKLGTVADTSYLLAWSSDGKMLAVASYLRQETSSNGAGSGGGLNSRLIQLVSSDGQLLKTLSGHSQSLTKLAWSPDGKRLASASLDKTVQLWK